MAANILIDVRLGVFPLIAAVADSAFKANVRDAAIFVEFLGTQERTVNVIDVEPQSLPM